MAVFFRGLVGSAFALAFYTTMLFAPTWYLTGGFDWPRGWEFLLLITPVYVIATIWLSWTDPDLMKDRTSLAGEQPLADKFATALLLTFIIVWFLFIPWDVHELKLLPTLPDMIGYWGGVALFLAGCFMIWRTFRANTFAANIVKTHEREQYVIDTGPYARVRHPMYSSFILFFVGIGLFLESSAAALIALPGTLLFLLPRILIEEKQLSQDLDGYADYTSRVRARVIPHVF
ncbi:MAG: isoprenylcysteine carboxylmethyltransferase family protein [Rhodobiaceae bacterium]|nr:isoprenylcysteine carboxylmethyltransferase family protein [Rhodobiaceae bacterium]